VHVLEHLARVGRHRIDLLLTAYTPSSSTATPSRTSNSSAPRQPSSHFFALLFGGGGRRRAGSGVDMAAAPLNMLAAYISLTEREPA
jgi:hypothetical protein